MSCLSCNAFGVTTRFRNGVNFDFLEKIKSYFKKCPMVYCIREKNDNEAHLHFQIWYDKNRSIDDVRKTFKRIIERSEGLDYEFPHCLKVVGAYNDSYYKEYCQKDIKEIIYNSVDKDKLLAFIYSHKKNEKDNRSLFEILKEQCEGEKNISNITSSCINYCVDNNKCPRRDVLKNIVWWIWMSNRDKDDRSKGELLLDDLKDKLKSPLKFKYY